MKSVGDAPSLKAHRAISAESLQSSSGAISETGEMTERHTSFISSVSWDPQNSRLTVLYIDEFNDGFAYQATCVMYDDDVGSQSYGQVKYTLLVRTAGVTGLSMYNPLPVSGKLKFSLAITGT